MNRLLRGVVVVGTLAFLALVPAAGGEVHPVLSLLAVALGVVAALRPASHAPGGLLLGLGALWLFAAPGDLDGWVLLAAADLLLVHLACTLAAYGPAPFEPGPELLRRWARRTGALLAVTVGVWGLARVADGVDVREGTARWAVGLALVVLLAWVGLLSARLADRPDA